MKAADLLELAITWLGKQYQDAVIVPELSVADWGGASIDVAAITENEIVGVEIKGEGDSPARLDLQEHVYGRVARRMWLLPDESVREKVFARRPRGWGKLEVFDGQVRAFNRARKAVGDERRKYPRSDREYVHTVFAQDNGRYDPDEALEIKLLCPYSMCGTLWRDELYDIARLNGVSMSARANVGPLTDAIVRQLPAPLIHDAMVEALRRRVWRSKRVIDLRKNSDNQRGRLLL